MEVKKYRAVSDHKIVLFALRKVSFSKPKGFLLVDSHQSIMKSTYTAEAPSTHSKCRRCMA